jgi:hypothetical protein
MYERMQQEPSPRSGAWTLALSAVTAKSFDRIFWCLTAVLLVGYIVLFATCSPYSLLDLPNHLARATVIADLLFHHGARFGGDFQLLYRYLLIPYVLGDVLLTGAVELGGTQFASALWMSIAFLSLPAAVLFYLRTAGAPRDLQPIAVLLATYLSIDYSFTLGFLEFRLGIALALVALALLERLRARWSVPLYCIYIGTLALGYLAHLVAVAFFAVAWGVTGLLRLRRGATSLGRELRLFAPVAVILAWHFGIAAHFHQPGDMPLMGYEWGLVRKLHTLRYSYIRFGGPVDTILALTLIACFALMLHGRGLAEGRSKPAFHEKLAICVTFLALFVLFPYGYSGASFVDLRALIAAELFLFLALFDLAGAGHLRSRLPVLAAAVFALAISSLNLAYVGRQFARAGAWAQGYRSVVTAVPRGARVLPVTTVGQHAPYLHAASSVVIDRAGTIPYLFSANNGNPMVYFRYTHQPYAPAEEWYALRGTDSPARVDWHKVGCAYPFLLVTRPYEPARIGLATTKRAENAEAVLLAVNPADCAATESPGDGLRQTLAGPLQLLRRH